MILAASEVKLVLLIRRSWVIRNYGVHLWHLMVVCVHLVTGVVLTMGLVWPRFITVLGMFAAHRSPKSWWVVGFTVACWMIPDRIARVL